MVNDKDTQKKLGQYFTGENLAKLLAVLASVENCKTAIDPMAGIGDMLVACSKLTNNKIQLSGIEIDPNAYKTLLDNAYKNKIESSKLLHGDAFDISTIKKLEQKKWDLVITNPPYVRYQNFIDKQINGVNLKNSDTIRKNLKEILNDFTELNQNDLSIFKILVDNYSGLSDLAVPSWILCSTLVKKNGILAIIVPESWLNREYSYIIQYMLLRFFKILYIVEDADSSWFKTAQVKTNLIIAQRIETRKSISNFDENDYHTKIKLTNNLNNVNSLIGKLYEGQNNPEKQFFESLKKLSNAKENLSENHLKVSHVLYKNFSKNLLSSCKNMSWFKALEKNNSKLEKYNSKYFLHYEIATNLNIKPQIQFTSLEDLGVNIGQGFRSGANKFFYSDIIKSSKTKTIVKPNKIFNVATLEIPTKYLKTVLRKQGEMPKTYSINSNMLPGRVFVFDNSVCSIDIKKSLESNQCNSSIYNDYELLNSKVEEFICKASTTNIGTKDSSKFIPKLSAVVPNIKKGEIISNNIKLPRFWYMLPKFKNRHLPDIAIPRINNLSPRAILNVDNKNIIDANFSTLWTTEKSKINKYALLALLNSNWVLLNMEYLASIFGGGALKLEASHIKKIPIPAINDFELKQLTNLGKELLNTHIDNSSDILKKINVIIETLIFENIQFKNCQKILVKMLNQKINDRRK